MSILGIFASLFGFGCNRSSSAKKTAATEGAQAMSELRRMALTKPFSELKIVPSDEFPRVYGVLMDWCIDSFVVTVVSFCDGNASLYTTSSFGTIGGIGHESVRSAAKQFVRLAEKYYDRAVPTDEYPCPRPGLIYFYLLTFEGVCVIEVEEAPLSSGQHPLSDLGDAAQTVITELREIRKQSP